MSNEIDKEQILPSLAAGWATFDAREADSRLVEGDQAFVEGTWAILDAKHQAGFIIAGGIGRLVGIGDHHKARGIGWIIFDVLSENR